MILGFVLAALILCSSIMTITRKCKNVHFQKWNHRIHKILGFVILITAIGHLAITWPLRFQRPSMMYVLGFLMVGMIIILIASYYLRKKIGKSWIWIHRIAAGAIILCLAGHIYLGIHSLQSYKMQINNITIDEVELNNIADGEYIGEENVGYIYCKVKVTVKNHSLTDVEILEHRTERGKPAESITDDIIKKQNIKVDAVSSATNSSKVIMKAVENALECSKE